MVLEFGHVLVILSTMRFDMTKKCDYCIERKWITMKKRGKWILGIAALTWVVILFVTLTSETDQQKADKAKKELSAFVTFSAGQFEISNLNSFDWANVQLDVNGGILKGGFGLKIGTMESGMTYTIASRKFTRTDGAGLTSTLAVRSFDIQCDLPEGKSGYYTATW